MLSKLTKSLDQYTVWSAEHTFFNRFIYLHLCMAFELPQDRLLLFLFPSIVAKKYKLSYGLFSFFAQFIWAK